MSSLKLNPLITKAIYNEIFPIGKTEIFYDNEDHSNYLGFTWERTSVGKVPVGIDTSDTDFNEIGKTGGEKTHTLTVDELANHSHRLNTIYPFTAGGGKTGLPNSNASSFYSSDYQTCQSTGGNQPHNNLQPYEVFAFWKRIA